MLLLLLMPILLLILILLLLLLNTIVTIATTVTIVTSITVACLPASSSAGACCPSHDAEAQVLELAQFPGVGGLRKKGAMGATP